MKLTIEVDDPSLLLDGLNNAIIAYNDIVSAFFLGCDVPEKWRTLEKGRSYDELISLLKTRMSILRSVYDQIENFLNEVNQD